MALPNHSAGNLIVISIFLAISHAIYAEKTGPNEATVLTKEECIALRGLLPEKQFEIAATGTDAEAELVLADLAFPGNAVLRNFEGLMKAMSGPHAALAAQKTAGGLGRTCRSEPQLKKAIDRFLLVMQTALAGQNSAIPVKTIMVCLQLIIPPGLMADSISHYPLEEVKNILFSHIRDQDPLYGEAVPTLTFISMDSLPCARDVMARLKTMQESLPHGTASAEPSASSDLNEWIQWALYRLNSTLEMGYVPLPSTDYARAMLLCKPRDEQLADLADQAERPDTVLVVWGNALYDNFAAIMKIAQGAGSEAILRDLVSDVASRPDNGLRRATLDELVTFLDEAMRTPRERLNRGKLAEILADTVPGGSLMSSGAYCESSHYGNERVYQIMMRYVDDPDPEVRYAAMYFFVNFARHEPSKAPEVAPISAEWRHRKVDESAETREMKRLRYLIEHPRPF